MRSNYDSIPFSILRSSKSLIQQIRAGVESLGLAVEPWFVEISNDGAITIHTGFKPDDERLAIMQFESDREHIKANISKIMQELAYQYPALFNDDSLYIQRDRFRICVSIQRRYDGNFTTTSWDWHSGDIDQDTQWVTTLWKVMFSNIPQDIAPEDIQVEWTPSTADIGMFSKLRREWNFKRAYCTTQELCVAICGTPRDADEHVDKGGYYDLQYYVDAITEMVNIVHAQERSLKRLLNEFSSPRFVECNLNNPADNWPDRYKYLRDGKIADRLKALATMIKDMYNFVEFPEVPGV